MRLGETRPLLPSILAKRDENKRKMTRIPTKTENLISMFILAKSFLRAGGAIHEPGEFRTSSLRCVTPKLSVEDPGVSVQ